MTDQHSALCESIVDTEPEKRPQKRKGRKRALLAAGSLLGVTALLTAAAFTDYALINVGGSGGFGTDKSSYDLQVSSGMEKTVDTVKAWSQANPDAIDITSISGASGLVPGGNAIIVPVPIKNLSTVSPSSLKLSFSNTTPAVVPSTTSTPVVTQAQADAQNAKNSAYAGLMRFDVAVVADASTVPTTWDAEGLDFTTTRSVALPDLAANSGKVVVIRVRMVDGSSQTETNKANGGKTTVQARFDGQALGS